MTRRIPEGLAAHAVGRVDAAGRPTRCWAVRIAGRRLGILGMGRIGQAVARRARAFGHAGALPQPQAPAPRDRGPVPRRPTGRASTRWCRANRCAVSVNCPHTPSTFHLLNARRLKLMKPSAVIVNTSRGEVIDENALTRDDPRRRDRGRRGLDVYERTGQSMNPRLRRVAQCGAAAAHGLRHGRGPGGDGREGDHQHQDLRRWAPAARSGCAGMF